MHVGRAARPVGHTNVAERCRFALVQTDYRANAVQGTPRACALRHRPAVPYTLPVRLLVSMRRTLSVCLGVLAVATGSAGAQGFQTLDPFYGGETARRGFHDGLAISGEVGYRGGDLLGLSEPGAPAGGGLAVMGQLDYAVLPQVDLSAVVDLSGGVGRGPLGLSWVVVKPHWHNEMTDYAVRVAVDPANEGGLGFRQTDAAFLSSTALSPQVTTDFAIGIRRVHTGYTDAGLADGVGRFDPRAVPADSPTDGNTVDLTLFGGSGALVAGDRVRLVGQELRGMIGYNIVFDPAGSRLILGLVGEAGNYAQISSSDDGEPDLSRRIRSGIGWARAGVEFSRPSYQISPYVSLPVVTWADVGGDAVRHGPRPDKVRFGLRATLR